MIALLLTLSVVAPPQDQEARATLQSCQEENGRWVCRYQLPEIEIVPAGGRGGTAAATQPPSVVIPPPVVTPTPAPTIDAGILTEREARLVSKCADAGWLSLCLPNERREARALRDKAQAYETVRLAVTRLLSENRCEDAVRTALESGHLALATQARGFCAAAPTG